MKTHVDASKNSKTQSAANETASAVKESESAAQLIDKRASTVIQRKLKSASGTGLPPFSQGVAQRKGGSMLKRPSNNKAGLPFQLKTGIEKLSGLPMDHVKVHYNSPKPAQLQAHAYAQGSNIHLAPGQEKHLPHEAWHVVQQEQGRVTPTKQLKNAVFINDNPALEQEADQMGAKAAQLKQEEKELVSEQEAPQENSDTKEEVLENTAPLSDKPVSDKVDLPEKSPKKKGRSPFSLFSRGEKRDGNGKKEKFSPFGKKQLGKKKKNSSEKSAQIKDGMAPEVAAAQSPQALGGNPIEAAPKTVAPKVNAEKHQTRGGIQGGSAATAKNFFNAPASFIAKNIRQVGSKVSKGFEEDSAALTQSTPAVHAAMTPAEIEAPEKTPKPENNRAPKAKNWVPPAAALRSDTPKFVPNADANPQKAEADAAAKKAQANNRADQVNAQIASTPGQERVQGRTHAPSKKVEIAASKTNVQANTTPEMNEYMNIDMSNSFRDQVDSASAGLFQSSLEAPKSKIETARIKRDKDQSKAILESNAQADALGKKASKDQAEAVSKSRTQISDEKDKSLAESKSVIDEYDGKVSQEKQSKIDEINSQIEKHEKKANSTLDDADKKVEKEQSAADKKVAKEEAAAKKKKKKKRKWWQKIGSFFKGIAKALKKAVTSIVNAVAKVVKAIVKAAKSLANSIINACTALVKSLIDALASTLKVFLSVALAAFPGIRDRLNAFIDKAVDAANAAVDQIGDALNAAVNKLCDTLTNIIDFAQNFYVSMIEGAFMMFEAIITGNFADLPRIAFMTACNSLGLPGDELWGIVQKAAGQAMNIVKHPAKFLRNLIKAGTKGFGQFMSNIKSHLMTGLMGWLMGQVGQTGLTIPKKFDGPSIFLLVRQVLGVTYEYVRERAVGIIGEENMERAEMVFAYLKRLFTEGPAVLFAELKEKAIEMKNTFVSQIEQWVISTVVQKAVIKVTSMLIPGSGFVQAIYGMWQTIQFFLENIKKIAAVVNSLLDSLAQIMKGAIGPAANLVEKTMVDTLPLVFTWLAKLVGINGIGAKIKSIIDKLRTPVNKAVDFVIKGAIKLGKKAVSKVKGAAKGAKDRVTGWWKKRTAFTTKKGAQHELYFKGEEENAVPMVASDDPMPVSARLSAWEKEASKSGANKEQKNAKAKISQAAALSVDDPTSAKLIQLIGELFDVFGEGESAQEGALNLADLDQPPVKENRTKEEMQHDLLRVTQLIPLIASKTKDTAEAEMYFAKAVARYRMQYMRFKGLGTSNVGVEAKINPIEFTKWKGGDAIKETAGTEETRADGSTPLKTKVEWKPGSLTVTDGTGTSVTAVVGETMTASVLGLDHPQGATASQNNGQNALMAALTRKLDGYKVDDTKQYYIKGHLLNDNLGGPADNFNLFPITNTANTQHLNFVERPVKEDIAAGYWGYYQVAITGVVSGIDQGGKPSVTSNIVCSYARLKSDGKKSSAEKTVTIQSVLGSKPEPSDRMEVVTKGDEHINKDIKKEVGVEYNETGAVPKGHYDTKNDNVELFVPAYAVLEDLGQCNNIDALRPLKGIGDALLISLNEGYRDKKKQSWDANSKRAYTILNRDWNIIDALIKNARTVAQQQKIIALGAQHTTEVLKAGFLTRATFDEMQADDVAADLEATQAETATELARQHYAGLKSASVKQEYLASKAASDVARANATAISNARDRVHSAIGHKDLAVFHANNAEYHCNNPGPNLLNTLSTALDEVSQAEAAAIAAEDVRNAFNFQPIIGLAQQARDAVTAAEQRVRALRKKAGKQWHDDPSDGHDDDSGGGGGSGDGSPKDSTPELNPHKKLATASAFSNKPMHNTST